MRGAGRRADPALELFNPLDDHYGLAPLAAAQTALDTHNAAGFWNKALLDNSARPSGALVYAGPDGATSHRRAVRAAEAGAGGEFSGAANAGRPLLLEGGLDWKALSLSPKDMDFIETKAAAAREIALAFGVPPLLLGLPGDNTFANYAEANRAFWRQTVIPLVRATAEGVSRLGAAGLRAFPPRLRRRPHRRAGEGARAEWSRIGGAAFLTVDEQREAAGYGPMGGGRRARGDSSVPPTSRASQPARRRAGSGRVATEAAALVDVALNTIRASSSDTGDLISQIADLIDLRDEEVGDFGGHAIAEHVGKSEDYLIDRAQTAALVSAGLHLKD